MAEHDEWQRVEIPDLGLAFGYPRRTPSGQSGRLDDVRLHARSDDGVEAYFELSRHLDVTSMTWYVEERGSLVARFGAEVTPLVATTFHDKPAHEFSVTFADTVRAVVLIERGPWLYRVIYDPRSPLNHAVLETIQID